MGRSEGVLNKCGICSIAKYQMFSEDRLRYIPVFLRIYKALQGIITLYQGQILVNAQKTH